MTSGIYKLTFPDGSIYIGKSVDIQKRWSQHNKALTKGTHTKRMQEVYNKFGPPKYEVIFECHPDHIDILETYFINKYWSGTILNSTRPADINDNGLKILSECAHYVWDLSTFEHIQRWSDTLDKVEELQDTIEASKDAILLITLEDKLASANKEINGLKNRGFWSRVFNRSN